jgi:hypothetical protein
VDNARAKNPVVHQANVEPHGLKPMTPPHALGGGAEPSEAWPTKLLTSFEGAPHPRIHPQS